MPALFENIEWGSNRVLAQTMDIIAREKLTVSLLPLWYDVDDERSLELLISLCSARRLAAVSSSRAPSVSSRASSADG
jgi:glycosyltransferase A (GT-A) superfamily protein (DUF2064 family)